jgi:hypothetical protein
MTIGLLPSLAIVVGALYSSTPSRVKLSLRGRLCLWGPSRTILRTTLFGVADFGALTQCVHAGRAARNGESLCTLREAQVVSYSWWQEDLRSPAGALALPPDGRAPLGRYPDDDCSMSRFQGFQVIRVRCGNRHNIAVGMKGSVSVLSCHTPGIY